MDLDATLDKHDITHEQLVDIAMLCGTDFNEGITGIGPKTAVKTSTRTATSTRCCGPRRHVDHADRIRDLFLDPAATDDYEIPDSIEPASMPLARSSPTSGRSMLTRSLAGSNALTTQSSRPDSTVGRESRGSRPTNVELEVCIVQPGGPTDRFDLVERRFDCLGESRYIGIANAVTDDRFELLSCELGRLLPVASNRSSIDSSNCRCAVFSFPRGSTTWTVESNTFGPTSL